MRVVLFIAAFVRLFDNNSILVSLDPSSFLIFIVFNNLVLLNHFDRSRLILVFIVHLCIGVVYDVFAGLLNFSVLHHKGKLILIHAYFFENLARMTMVVAHTELGLISVMASTFFVLMGVVTKAL